MTHYMAHSAYVDVDLDATDLSTAKIEAGHWLGVQAGSISDCSNYRDLNGKGPVIPVVVAQYDVDPHWDGTVTMRWIDVVKE